MGKLAPARKLMKTPGLRYVDVIAEAACKRLKDKPAGLKEFVDLCKPLAFSNLSFLNDVLIDAFENNPNEIQDLWIQMQEEAYLPTDDQLVKMARILKKHGREVPFDVPETMMIPPKKKKSPPPKESVPAKKEEPEKRTMTVLEDLTTIDLAMKELIERSADKSISVGLIRRIIELMKGQNNLSRFEELCVIMGKNRPIINSLYMELEREFSSQEITSINLSDETKAKCRWDRFITRKSLSIENFDEYYTFLKQNAKLQNVKWFSILTKKPEFAPQLQEEIKKLNDREVSSHFIIACIDLNQQDIAKDLLQTQSIVPEIFSNWCSNINVEQHKKALDFGKDNFPAELLNELRQTIPKKPRK